MGNLHFPPFPPSPASKATPRQRHRCGEQGVKGCQGQGAVYTGPSDLNVILGVISNFLDKPYNSIEDPLDLWFRNLPAGSVTPAFSIGYSVGMAKSLSSSGKSWVSFQVIWVSCSMTRLCKHFRLRQPRGPFKGPRGPVKGPRGWRKQKRLCRTAAQAAALEIGRASCRERV